MDATVMWMYTALIWVTLIDFSESKRHSLQDYQKRDGLRLIRPDRTFPTKSRSLSVVKCARSCSSSKRMPFTCRAFYFDQKNRKCHWLSFDSYTPGIQTDHNLNYDLYEKKDYVKQCITGTGLNYRGTISVTKTKIKCQAWASTMPHDHNFLPARNKKEDLRENHCRNPDNETTGPWCFTTNPQIRHQSCAIPQCSEVECVTCNGESYRGPVDHTESGKECQRWNLMEPHRHPFHPKRYPDKGLNDNYCRNPDSHLSKTRSGIQCAPWDDHSRSWEQNSTVLNAGLEMNFCRNPDNDKHGPWCYTNDSSVPWDYCMIKPCKLPPSPGKPKSDVSNVSCFVHIKTRIIGGDQVKIKEGSWMVSIQKGNSHWCGGSLIREDWVLTDRQCFSSCVPDLTEYSVRMGFVNLNAWDRNVSRKQELKISHVICGPEGSNLAMLKLSQPAFQSEYVRRIELPVAGCSMKEGTNCTVFGWGETKGTGHEGVLKAVQLPIVSNEKCHWYHRGNLPITETKICAGGIKDKGVCERDYGGPLMCQEGGSKVILGVSIHGRGCARANRPAIFVNVPYYTQWIHKVFRYYSNLENNY
ncbi:hepatocyte growth factor-like isoform X2 [Brienomyrus brachyistius]|uniref:hepatocyte growth factor-like isoform X2 n=1 Tax=Brienomyrus brachyistius TaxID=42636 RepID=UPI0020B19E18|nr:hepatocyte growth factor-like isoform X2 [Brienomyrus brachyistius]